MMNRPNPLGEPLVDLVERTWPSLMLAYMETSSPEDVEERELVHVFQRMKIFWVFGSIQGSKALFVKCFFYYFRFYFLKYLF